jgi:deoxyribodipyrimidine photolyase-related protein
MQKASTLRLVLGDQLNPEHSWFQQIDNQVLYVLMEVRQETDYVLHHAQKVIAIFAAMRWFAKQIEANGHRVHYISISDPANAHSIPVNIEQLVAACKAKSFEYQEPDEYRLDAQLADAEWTLAVPRLMRSSEHFFTDRLDVSQLLGANKQWLMETFYRKMRTRHAVLLQADGKPEGGAWNFDHDNRKAWKGDPPVPADTRELRDHNALWAELTSAGVNTFGNPQADRFAWPIGREDALKHLEAFVANALPFFGDFQDAMSGSSWRLFHSLISFALNTKMLNPREVVARVERAWRAGLVPLASAEGFIRQILGWREYVRGVYWARMPGYEQSNYFEHSRPLPSWFWTGKTKLRCVAQAVGQSLDYAYAHHIQRLMVIGNFALLAGLAPESVHHWYLGVYIDAFEWVELPNTLGMSQFADGGALATKPYVSSAAYIDRMSDACKGCYYDKKAKLGPKACPFNALYWDFFARNADKLAKNPRISLVYKQLEKMAPDALVQIRARAAEVVASLDTL